MPKVWHLAAADAQAALHEAGVAYEVHRAPNNVVPVGALIAVSPRPGVVLASESTVILTISTGPPLRPTENPDG
jgi:beta-lactam-binding protein with PASTA domain